MMRDECEIHDLKTHKAPFAALWNGEKTAEFRRDDRGFRVGDVLRLKEWDEEAERFTGSAIWAHITHVTSGPRFGIPEGYAMLSLGRTVRYRERANPTAIEAERDRLREAVRTLRSALKIVVSDTAIRCCYVGLRPECHCEVCDSVSKALAATAHLAEPEPGGEGK